MPYLLISMIFIFSTVIQKAIAKLNSENAVNFNIKLNNIFNQKFARI